MEENNFELTVYIAAEGVPSGADIEEILKDLGLNLELPEDTDFVEHSGELRCLLDGDATSLELFSEKLSDEDKKELELPDFCELSIVFCPDHDEDDSIEASAWLAAALAKATNGILFDGHSGEECQGEEAFTWIQDFLDDE